MNWANGSMPAPFWRLIFRASIRMIVNVLTGFRVAKSSLIVGGSGENRIVLVFGIKPLYVEEMCPPEQNAQSRKTTRFLA